MFKQRQKKIERIRKLELKVEIKDDVKNNYFYDNVKIHGETIRSKARYNKCTKEEALRIQKVKN